MTGERQVPFFCPYCGEEALRPSGPQPGDWECGACLRGFQLKFTTILRPGGQPAADAQPAAAGQPAADGEPAAEGQRA